MPQGTRLVAIAIGVADPSCDRMPPDLPRLGAAINGARAFFEWSTAVGYDARLLTDEDEPVTVAKLRSVLEEMLPPRAAPAHRLIIYFAGHGLLGAAEQALWLLSAWRSDGHVVGVQNLKRMLYRYGLAQIAIFADACRSLPGDIDCLEVTADGVLGIGPEPRVEADVDTFFATQDAAATYAVPGETPEMDRCIFSGVLLEGLWGVNPAVVSTKQQNTVTGHSLKAFLKSEVPRIAKMYDVDLNPSANANFDEDDDVYLGRDLGTQRPTFPPWPPLGSLLAMGWPIRERGGFKSAPPIELPRPPDEGAGGFAPPSSIAVYSPVDFAVWMRDGSYTKRRAIGSEFWSAEKCRAVTETHKTVWMGVAVGFPTGGPRPALIAFDDGLFAPVTALPKFTAAVRYETGRGVSALVYRERDAASESGCVTEAAIVQMEKGRLRSDDVKKLARKFAENLHREQLFAPGAGGIIDPVLGVISAYLYDAIGDVDTIRRMAFWYAKTQQPIPYDLVLLANLQAIREDARGLWVHVPAVRKRGSRRPDDDGLEWTMAATDSVEGLVAGHCPWMRQGWALLDEFGNEGTSTLVPPILHDVRNYLSPGRFTTLKQEGGRMFATMLELSNIHASPKATR